MIIEKEIQINKNIAEAWKVLGTEFANAHVWASSLSHSEGSGGKFNGSECSERSCDIKGMDKTKEQLISFSNENHTLSYLVAQGMPSMVKYATNTWTLNSAGADKTKLIMKMDIRVGGMMGWMMQPMMKLMMGKMGNTLITDFKYFVEHGKPSEAKLKSLNSKR